MSWWKRKSKTKKEYRVFIVFDNTKQETVQRFADTMVEYSPDMHWFLVKFDNKWCCVHKAEVKDYDKVIIGDISTFDITSYELRQKAQQDKITMLLSQVSTLREDVKNLKSVQRQESYKQDKDLEKLPDVPLEDFDKTITTQLERMLKDVKHN